MQVPHFPVTHLNLKEAGVCVMHEVSTNKPWWTLGKSLNSYAGILRADSKYNFYRVPTPASVMGCCRCRKPSDGSLQGSSPLSSSKNQIKSVYEYLEF